jgi:hypothetical protein
MSPVLFFIAEMAGQEQEMKRKKMTKKKMIFNGSAFGRPDQVRPTGGPPHHSASLIQPEGTPSFASTSPQRSLRYRANLVLPVSNLLNTERYAISTLILRYTRREKR